MWFPTGLLTCMQSSCCRSSWWQHPLRLAPGVPQPPASACACKCNDLKFVGRVNVETQFKVTGAGDHAPCSAAAHQQHRCLGTAIQWQRQLLSCQAWVAVYTSSCFPINATLASSTGPVASPEHRRSRQHTPAVSSASPRRSAPGSATGLLAPPAVVHLLLLLPRLPRHRPCFPSGRLRHPLLPPVRRRCWHRGPPARRNTPLPPGWRTWWRPPAPSTPWHWRVAGGCPQLEAWPTPGCSSACSCPCEPQTESDARYLQVGSSQSLR